MNLWLTTSFSGLPMPWGDEQEAQTCQRHVQGL